MLIRHIELNIFCAPRSSGVFFDDTEYNSPKYIGR